MLARSRPKHAPTPALDGVIELPPGKIATVATFPEMPRDQSAHPRTDGQPAHAPRLDRLAGDLPRYRRLYRSVGERWLWFSRAVMSDARLSAIISDPAVEPYAFVLDGQDAGIVELDFRKRPDCELAFLGLVPNAIGRGLGRCLIHEAIRRAFARPTVERLWLHTCTLDHPAALRFYMEAGFRPYRRAVEVADDPRLSGHLPREVAPELPML